MSEQDRAALVLKITRQLQRAGRARGWSDAMKQAEALVAQKEGTRNDRPL